MRGVLGFHHHGMTSPREQALTRVADVNLNVAVAVDVVGFALDPLLHPVRAGDVNAQNLKSVDSFSSASLPGRSLACSSDAIFGLV